MTTTRATLMQDSRALAFGEPVALGLDGPKIVFDIPRNVLLERAELTLEAPDDSVSLPIQPTITASGKLAEPVDWVCADWGMRRPITSLHVIFTKMTKVLLKVAEGGPWYPPMPFDVISLKEEKIQLSGVTGTRLLVEPIEQKSSEDKPKKTPDNIKSIKVEVAARPPDIMVSIGDETPFFHHPLLLDPKQVLVLRDELNVALQRAWPADLRGGKIEIKLRSSADSRLHLVNFAFDTCLVIRTWDGDQKAATLRLDAGNQSSIELPDFSEGTPQSLVFFIQTAMPPEKVPLLSRPKTDPLRGSLIGAKYRAAQAFSSFDAHALLVGLDILVKPLTPIVKGTLAIHPDAFGRPADVPLDGATIEFIEPASERAPWEPRWVKTDFSTPISIKNGIFWVVVDVSEGEALWPLGTSYERQGPDAIVPGASVFQAPGDRVWREREPWPAPDTRRPPFACTRPRFRATSTPPPPKIEVQWGDSNVPATIGNDGRVFLDEKALSKLERPTTDDDTRIRVCVTSRVSATVTLSNVEMKIPQKAT